MLPPIRLPAGVRDFLPAAAARRRSLAERVLAVFEAWGYARIITPAFECADVLERGLGANARATAIRFVEPGSGDVVALRPDITPQIARVVATRLADVEPPIRLCYEGSVTRLAGEHGQREILQAGIELVGVGEPAGDAEVLAVAAAALAAAQLGDARLDIGHVAPARFVLDEAGDRADAVARALAKKDRAGLRVASKNSALADALVTLWGPAEPTLARAKALPWPADVQAVLAQLERVLAAFAELVDPPAPALSIDLGDVRGFDYYTGVRFAGYATGAPDAVLRGGRYDALLGRYGRSERATGFAIDLELVAQAHAEPVPTARAVAISGPGAAALARELRARGIRTVVGAVTASWLRSASFDAALALDRGEITFPDGRVVAGDGAALLAML